MKTHQACSPAALAPATNKPNTISKVRGHETLLALCWLLGQTAGGAAAIAGAARSCKLPLTTASSHVRVFPDTAICSPGTSSRISKSMGETILLYTCIAANQCRGSVPSCLEEQKLATDRRGIRALALANLLTFGALLVEGILRPTSPHASVSSAVPLCTSS